MFCFCSKINCSYFQLSYYKVKDDWDEYGDEDFEGFIKIKVREYLYLDQIRLISLDQIDKFRLDKIR